MPNLAMKRKVEKNECIDIKDNKKTPEGYYILEDFIEGMDYCDQSAQAWIWSIGISYKTGQILAATNTVFYQNEDFECLFLR